MSRPLAAVIVALLAGCATGPRQTASAGAPELDRCRESLADLRESQAEREARQRQWRVEELFVAGAPQPDAERNLGQLFAQTFARQAGKPVAHALVCRTWVCKLVITGSGTTSLRFPDHMEDIIIGSWDDSRRDVDAAGAPVQVFTSLLLLRHPAGERRTKEQRRAEAMLPAPASAEDCRAQLADLQQRDKEQRARERQEQARRDPAIAFQLGKPSPVLTEDTARRLRTLFALAEQPTERLVACTENVCKVLVPPEGDRFRQLHSGAIGYRYDLEVRQEGGQGVMYLWWRTEGWGNTRRLLVEARQAVDAARGRCAKLAPGRGGLTVRAQLPASTASAPPTPILMGEGSLVGTPLGRCLTDLIVETIGASTVHGPFAKYSRNFEFLFPAR